MICQHDIAWISRFLKICSRIFCRLLFGSEKVNMKYLLLSNVNKYEGGWIDGWLAILRPFTTVFQSYQDDRRVIMKGCEQWNPIYD